jgi:hypothetical protein
MSNTSVAIAEVESRQALIRVWMAISAIWIAFWIAIALPIVFYGEATTPLFEQFRLFAVIVLVPPVVLLVAGAAVRWLFETLALKSGRG